MADLEPNYLTLAEHYEQCLAKHGATPQGVDWPNASDLTKRFHVMLDVLANKPFTSTTTLLDLGCGYGALLDHIHTYNQQSNILYTGIDISANMIRAAQQRLPGQCFLQRDILIDPLPPGSFDYIIMNGLLTEKRNLPWHEMVKFAQRIIKAAFDTCREGIAFNVMSYHVDWSHPALFHWSLDEAAAFLFKHCSRHVVFRNDYGLYEYTVYVYKTSRYTSQLSTSPVPSS